MRQALTKGVLSAAAATSILSLPGQTALAADAHGQATGSPGFLSGNNVQAPLEVPVNACGNSVNGAAALSPSFGNSCATSSASSDEPAPERAAAPKPAPKPAPAVKPAPAPAHKPATKPATPHHGSHDDDGGALAAGDVLHAPGVLAGNLLKTPLDVPVDACGNSGGVVAALAGALGNKCDDPAPEPRTPHEPNKPVPHENPVRPPVKHVTPPEKPQAPRTVPRASEFLKASATARPAARAAAPEAVEGKQLAATGMEENVLGAAGAGAGLLLGGALLYRRGRRAS